MKTATRIKDFQRMYDELTNPEKLSEARRKAERKKRIEEKKLDTGL